MDTRLSTQPEEQAPARVAAAPSDVPWLRRLYWSVRRELWESRSVYLVPFAVATLVVVGFMIRAVHLPGAIRAAAGLDAAAQRALIQEPYSFAALLIMASTLVVALYYCLESLQGERRDRSILFWKSLPVSDGTTVLAKASVPLVILPLLTFVVTFITHVVMLLVSVSALALSGAGVEPYWSQVALVPVSLVLLYHFVAVHSLWYAPIFAWLLLASAWARRAALLWAVVPLLAVGILERIAFGTSHFARLLQNRFVADPSGGDLVKDLASAHPLAHATPAHFLSSPGLWMGLAFAALFLLAATRLRRIRGPV